MTRPPRLRILARLAASISLLLLVASPALGQAELDWTMVTWKDGDLSNTYTMSNGVDITITVSTEAKGSFSAFVVGEGTVESPYVDGPEGSHDLFGADHDLGILFDPESGEEMSPVLIDLELSEPVTDLEFEISDIDWSDAGLGQDARRDEVVVTSDDGVPTLAEKDSRSPSYTIEGNTATADSSTSVEPGSDAGTIVVTFVDPVASVRITYNEVSGNLNPAARGIGVLATFSQVPVELMSFTVD